MDGSAGQRLGEVFLLPEKVRRTGQWGSQGLAAVWAQKNTRDAIFEAMRRKETYATTGPRISLRFFGGWDLSRELLTTPDWVTHAYASGVPMGGVLASKVATATANTSEGAVPSFILFAAKDTSGANLDRLQVIKAWVDAQGNSVEKIYDVAAAGQRKVNPESGLLPAIGSTVNVSDASYENNIGATQLSAHWQDPDFDPRQNAFYYARAIEIPTPRYSTYDAKALGIEAPAPTSIQERAVSSAIWYQP